MSADGLAALIGALALVVATAVLLAVFWERWHLAARIGVVLIAVLSVAAASAVQLNRLTEAIPGAAQVGAKQVAETGSRMLTLRVHGRASGLTLTMYAYLPAAYHRHRERFPVVEALHGYPGSPSSWLVKLHVQRALDTEIAAGRMAPTVVLFPWQTPKQLLDTECTNLKGGPAAETFLTEDVPAYVKAHFRVRTDRAGWGLTGYSAGGFCAVNLALRHPGEYAAAASMSGYSSPGITIGDGSEKTLNNPGWRLRHLPQPDLALWLGWASDDNGTRRASTLMAGLVRAPMTVTTAVVVHGGHSSAVWRQMEPPAFDWLSAHLGRPLP